MTDIYLCLLYYYFIPDINLELKKLTLIFIVPKLKRNCKQLVYIWHELCMFYIVAVMDDWIHSHSLYNSTNLLSMLIFLLRLGYGFGRASLVQVGIMMARVGVVLFVDASVLIVPPEFIVTVLVTDDRCSTSSPCQTFCQLYNTVTVLSADHTHYCR